MSGAALRQPGGIPNQAVSCLGAPSGACKHHPRTRTPHPPQEVELHQPLLALGRLGSEERSCEPNYIGHWPPLAGENLTITRVYIDSESRALAEWPGPAGPTKSFVRALLGEACGSYRGLLSPYGL